MGIHRIHTYPAYGGPGPVTGGLGDDSGGRELRCHIGCDTGGKGVNDSSVRTGPETYCYSL